MKNAGFDIFNDEALREEIINIYENTYLNLAKSQTWGNTVRPDWDPFILEHFIRDQEVANKGGLIPRDFRFIANSYYFYGLIDFASTQKGFLSPSIKEVLKRR